MSIQSYIPLARKYRPSRFSELSGQSSTSSSLANAIKLGREPHAVIFSGVRGVGKTTSARLYAKALNCKNPVQAEPCNECESCRAIAIGNHEDVIEIDGASNTSVDDIRSLRETVTYVPQRSRFKVYIIDEVHMLSQSAFNALLKTIEEPPPHVIFIFATTEIHKIPQTIMSRCQLFQLQRLGITAIRDRIVHILTIEGISFEEKAVAMIAREGHGSMRDALTLLDHVIAIGDGVVSVDALGQIIAHASSTQFLTLLDALVQRNASTVIQTLSDLDSTGIQMQDVVERLATLARHGFIVRDLGSDSLDFKTLGFDDEEVRQLTAIAQRAGPADLNRIFRTLAKAREDLDGSVLDRFILENYCLEWCLDPGMLLLANRHQATPERTTSPRVNSPQALSSVTGPSAVATLSSVNKPSAVTTLSAPEKRTSLPATWRELVDQWKQHKPLQAKRLEDVHPIEYSPSKIELVIPSESFLSAALLKPDEQKKLKESFAELFGYHGPLVCTPKASVKAHGQSPATVLPESLKVIQQREEATHKEKIIQEAKDHPVTKDALELFNATIESIEIHERH